MWLAKYTHVIFLGRIKLLTRSNRLQVLHTMSIDAKLLATIRRAFSESDVWVNL